MQKLFQVVVFYFGDIPEEKYMSDVQHGNIASRLCIQGLVNCKEFRSTEGATEQSMEETFKGKE